MGMLEIKDMSVYLSRMEKAMFDKLFFIDKVFEPFANVVDFGCADGSLIRALRGMTEEYRYIGYDLSEDMLRKARENQSDVFFTSDWETLPALPRESLLNLSSVIHEVYSYRTQEQIEQFWDRTFSSGFQYVTIRDMMFSETDDGPANAADVLRVREQPAYTRMLQDFEAVWGPVTSQKNLVHFLLKYRYPENWDRELHENYFALSLEEMKMRIPSNYAVTYLEHFPLPYIAWEVRREFGLELTTPTHIKIVLERRS